MFDYIVIGAGLSGLATAWRLKQKGEENVLIVEARNRIGGRTHTETVEVAGENINVDMGASYIMGVDSNPLVQYLKTKAKMKFDALVLDEENAQFYDSGPVSLETARKIEVSEVHHPSCCFWQVLIPLPLRNVTTNLRNFLKID